MKHFDGRGNSYARYAWAIIVLGLSPSLLFSSSIHSGQFACFASVVRSGERVGYCHRVHLCFNKKSQHPLPPARTPSNTRQRSIVQPLGFMTTCFHVRNPVNNPAGPFQATTAHTASISTLTSQPSSPALSPHTKLGTPIIKPHPSTQWVSTRPRHPPSPAPSQACCTATPRSACRAPQPACPGW